MKFYKNKVFFVWVKFVWFLLWEVNIVFEGYEYYDNDVSINGDGWV